MLLFLVAKTNSLSNSLHNNAKRLWPKSINLSLRSSTTILWRPSSFIRFSAPDLVHPDLRYDDIVDPSIPFSDLSCWRLEIQFFPRYPKIIHCSSLDHPRSAPRIITDATRVELYHAWTLPMHKYRGEDIHSSVREDLVLWMLRSWVSTACNTTMWSCKTLDGDILFDCALGVGVVDLVKQ